VSTVWENLTFYTEINLIILTLLILYYGTIPFFSEAFRGFPIIRELEIPLNGLRSIRLSPGDYPTLEVKLIFTS
jgi:hypothetical protein